LSLVVALEFRELRTGLRRFEAQLAPIEYGEELPLAYLVAFLDEDPHHFAARARDHLGVGLGLERGGPCVAGEDFAAPCRHGLDRNLGDRGFVGAVPGATSTGAEQAEEGDRGKQ
jgi:hypothetical protein